MRIREKVLMMDQFSNRPQHLYFYQKLAMPKALILFYLGIFVSFAKRRNPTVIALTFMANRTSCNS